MTDESASIILDDEWSGCLSYEILASWEETVSCGFLSDYKLLKLAYHLSPYLMVGLE